MAKTYKGKLLTEEEYRAGKALFQELMSDGRLRCQAYSRTKIKSMLSSSDYPYVDLSIWAQAQCRNPVSEGYGVCGRHGAGFASRGKRGGRPLLHGRYSKALKDLRLRERYEEALADEKLYELREEMALLGARVADLLESWSEDAPDMEELSDVVISLGQSLSAQDLQTAQDEYLRLAEIVAAGKGQWYVWKEIRALIEQQRKLTVTELGRLEKLQNFLTAQQAMGFLASIVDILDRAQLPIEMRRNIAQEFRTLAERRVPIPPVTVDMIAAEIIEEE